MEEKDNKADFFSRAMAFLIDAAFLSMLIMVSYGLLACMTLLLPPFEMRNVFSVLGVFSLLAAAVPFLLGGCYFVVLHSFGGQTLGKIFMGIQVVPQAGTFLSLGTSFLRLVGYLVSFFPLGAGFFWVVLDKDSASWHDKLSGSQVIYLER
ncbi:MAG: RDD family protein [Desulfobulbaceae bacterium]|nr:RDD family protein [Desulfobulbaceae bacterium]